MDRYGEKEGSSVYMTERGRCPDSDYYNSDNEGHILVKLINDSAIEDDMEFKTGEAFCQGVFVQNLYKIKINFVQSYKN